MVRLVFCGLLFFFSLTVTLPPHRPPCERVSYCLETSPPSTFPPQDRASCLTLLSLFLSFIFCPTSFRREWAAFLDAWGPPSVFRSCFVEVAQHSNDLLMNLWGRKWSPCPIPLPSCLFSNYDFLVTWLFSNYEILNYILLKESNTAILVTRIASTAFFPWLLLAAGVLPSEVSFL